LAALGALAACTLNPQPLPPLTGGDSGSGAADVPADGGPSLGDEAGESTDAGGEGSDATSNLGVDGSAEGGGVEAGEADGESDAPSDAPHDASDAKAE
jgi:hypothetical protein